MRTLKQLAEEALMVQDASNPLGVSKGYARALDDLHSALKAAGLPNGSDDIRLHPINVLWVNKLDSLAGYTDSRFSEAYTAVGALAVSDPLMDIVNEAS